MITMRMKVLRFDCDRIRQAMDGATRRALNKTGGWIRKTARRSIRRREGISEPGDPPHSHIGLLRDLLVYGYDPYAQTIVIGPLVSKRGEAPNLLEFGGVIVRRVVSRRRKLSRRRMVYRPRPFMAPALNKALAQPDLIPGFWRNQLGGI